MSLIAIAAEFKVEWGADRVLHIVQSRLSMLLLGGLGACSQGNF